MGIGDFNYQSHFSYEVSALFSASLLGASGVNPSTFLGIDSCFQPRFYNPTKTYLAQTVALIAVYNRTGLTVVPSHNIISLV